ncbi:hypothetical protein [Cardiobacterium valvarum]|uniref:Uncharacterized protein n=1 Tax=Cardiobacterium valvarum TaxID=194702 RepID=A0A381EA38_9GAMM|nr:hypothetical protein [Cardiobacterium valvarum]SUX23654.1 Uncharacterised protein [Cardiobacterium valvarum]
MPKPRAILLLVALTLGVQAGAQYITGEEQPLRPDPIPAGQHTVQQPAEAPVAGKKNKKTQKKGEQPAAAEQPLPSADNLETYTAAQIVEQAQAEAAAKQEAAQKAAEQATQAEAAAKAAAEQAAAQSSVQDTQAVVQNGDNQVAELPAQGADSGEIPGVEAPQDDADNVALLPVERLTPPPPPTETVIVEQAIYRCPQGKGYIYVDADAKKGRGRCTLYRAAKTEEVPVGSQPEKPLPGGNASCSGTLNYKGNTYLFRDGMPCPIPDNIFRRLTPAASSR